MANPGAKKRKEENSRHMKKRLRIIIARLFSTFPFNYIMAGIFHSTFKWKHWIGLTLTSFAFIIPYKQLGLMAKPAYGDDGELLDGGFNLSTGGVCGYLHDIIYITCFVQLTSIISENFRFQHLQHINSLAGLVKGIFVPRLRGTFSCSNFCSLSGIANNATGRAEQMVGESSVFFILSSLILLYASTYPHFVGGK